MFPEQVTSSLLLLDSQIPPTLWTFPVCTTKDHAPDSIRRFLVKLWFDVKPLVRHGFHVIIANIFCSFRCFILFPLSVNFIHNFIFT
ncbi:hypothetical protein C0J52_03916 [Blattella germanica]|nr:hypothetical protein C0J52_03916 [Blattella germanica]